MLRSLFSFVFLPLTSARVYFSETFAASWEKRWTKSQWKAHEGKQGEWKWHTGLYYGDEWDDKGIQTDGAFRYWGISAHFSPFSNEGKDLIIQYQVKEEKGIHCGGMYVKVGPKMMNATQFGSDTPYYIMFGPDFCGNDMKTQLIFQRDGQTVSKTTDLPYKQGFDLHYSQLYRMILSPDNKVIVEIGNEEVYRGYLKEDWVFGTPKLIGDPEDKKPVDWVEDSMMDDPEAKKPGNWVDEKRLTDLLARQPLDWVEDEDGEWEKPMIDNPAFIGEWTAPRIANPAWHGFWNPRKIDNPEYKDPGDVYKFEDISYFGIDVWQVQGHTVFDNIIICDHIDDANHFKEKWRLAKNGERQRKDKMWADGEHARSISHHVRDMRAKEDAQLFQSFM